MPALEVYHEILPDSYVLILAENAELPSEMALATVLRQAARSGKPAVWVDCSHVHELSTQALDLFAHYHTLLHHRHTPLVLCHLDDHLQQQVRQLPDAARPPMVATLLDADHYCHCQS